MIAILGAKEPAGVDDAPQMDMVVLNAECSHGSLVGEHGHLVGPIVLSNPFWFLSIRSKISETSLVRGAGLWAVAGNDVAITK